MLLCRYLLLGLLTVTQLTHTFVLLTANIDDVKKIARKFVSAPLAEKIADFLARASSGGTNIANVSEENEKNAEDAALFESDQEQFDKAARQGTSKRYNLETRTTPNRQDDTVSIERTTENGWNKAAKNVKVERIQHHKGIKYTWQREENENIPRAVKPQRLEEKRLYWQQEANKEEELVRPRSKEKWQKDENIWEERYSQDNDWRERLQESAESPIFKSNKKRQELKEASKRQEERLMENLQKWPKVETKEKQNYWPKFSPKTTPAPKPDRHSTEIFQDNQQGENNNPNNYEEPTPETKVKFIEENQDYDTSLPSTIGYEERIIEDKAKRQRNRAKNRERFAMLNNVEPETTQPSTIGIDLTSRFNGFNIDHSKVTNGKERNDFDKYNDLKYKMQYYPRSQLVATSGNVMLPKLQEDRKEAEMPKNPLTLPKVEPQSWWNQEKGKTGEM